MLDLFVVSNLHFQACWGEGNGFADLNVDHREAEGFAATLRVITLLGNVFCLILVNRNVIAIDRDLGVVNR